MAGVWAPVDAHPNPLKGGDVGQYLGAVAFQDYAPAAEDADAIGHDVDLQVQPRAWVWSRLWSFRVGEGLGRAREMPSELAEAIRTHRRAPRAAARHGTGPGTQ
jgi:hypothetical protein